MCNEKCMHRNTENSPNNTTDRSTALLPEALWQHVVAFHGHECPGLAIGFKAVEGAIDLFGLDIAQLSAVDEELVCVTENDACCVDAIQSLLGCTYGKGSLIPRLRGKMVFTFFVRNENGSAAKAVRLFLKPEAGNGMSRDEYQSYLLNTPYTELFVVSEPRIALPEPARYFASEYCSVCGEYTAEYGLRLQEGKLVCLDCYSAYEREGF